MQILKGVCLSNGVAIGPAFRFKRDLCFIPDHQIKPEDIEAELHHFKTALQKATNELEDIRALLEYHLDAEHARMIEAQLLVLSDTELLRLVEEKVRLQHDNVIKAYWEAMSLYENILNSSDYAYQRQRLGDLQDVKRRVIHHLQIQEAYTSYQLGAPAIFVTERVSPADIINLYQQNALGIITKQGGRDSHAAILARAFRLPFLSEVHDLEAILHSQEIILSADEEQIILEASAEVRQKYLLNVQRFNYERQLTTLRQQQPLSRDKVPIKLWANAGFLNEVENLSGTTISGIGLFRTEYLCLTHNAIPDEEEQFNLYRQILTTMAPKPVTFRTFDFGRDKLLLLLNLSPTILNNSTIGEGGIRFSLDNPQLLRTQLRALLRASPYGQMQVMFPLVFDCNDIIKVKAILSEVLEDLRTTGLQVKAPIPLGAMIETTQILSVLDDLAQLVDFFSIGTNDLTLYLLKTTRQTDTAVHYYHPLLYQTIDRIITTSAKHQKPVTVCGEMAADPHAALGLLALGVRSLSVNTPALYPLIQMIRRTSIKKLNPLRQQILQAQTAQQVKEALENWSRPPQPTK